MTRRWLAKSEYGPRQLCDVLGLAEYQRDRAISDRIIPEPDTKRGRWKRAVVEDLLVTLTPEIRASLGSLPDLGAIRAAEWLTDQLERGADPVRPDTIEELARQGVLRVLDVYKGHPVYGGRGLERLADNPSVNDELARAQHPGRMRTIEETAQYLAVRRSDVEHVIRTGWLAPARIAEGPYRQAVPLYRTGDLDNLLADPELDWAAVRATPPGRPSPFRHLPVQTEEGEHQ